MNQNRIAFALLLIAGFGFVLSACSDVLSRFAKASQANPPAKQSVPLSQKYSDPALQDFFNDLLTKLKKRDALALEALAQTYREKKERFKGGGWKIRSFYSIITSPAVDNPDDKDWEQHLAFLREWKEKFPQSITPRAALAGSYLTYAWEARGDGYANSVSNAGWQDFVERIDKAEAELNEAAKITDKCYGYYDAWLAVAKAEALNHERYDLIFDEAVRYDPSYQYFYREKATNLLPRWHGEPGEWEDFADNVKTKLGDRDGLKMYYQIVANISRYHGSNFFQTNRVSWEDTKKGFELFEQDYGMSREKLNEFGRLSFYASDAQISCKIFQRLPGENDFEPDVWNGERKYFEQFRTRGLQWCQFPKFENQAK